MYSGVSTRDVGGTDFLLAAVRADSAILAKEVSWHLGLVRASNEKVQIRQQPSVSLGDQLMLLSASSSSGVNKWGGSGLSSLSPCIYHFCDKDVNLIFVEFWSMSQ